MRLALKVDVDTFTGARDGLPRLLDLFRDLDIRATFFFTYGPDCSGQAIWKCLRPGGFLRKMLRSRALRLYGWRTVLSGTLLPSPRIGQRCESVLRRARDEGHEVAPHGWNHRRWQDRLDRLRDEDVREEIDRAFEFHAATFREAPRAFAAPAWVIDGRAYRELERHGIRYSSSTRCGRPFRPRTDVGDHSTLLEIPSTLPCPEEILAEGRTTAALFPDLGSLANDAVYPAHAEIEGGVYLEDFRAWLRGCLEKGRHFVSLSEMDEAQRTAWSTLEIRNVVSASIPGRPDPVSTGYPEECRIGV